MKAQIILIGLVFLISCKKEHINTNINHHLEARFGLASEDEPMLRIYNGDILVYEEYSDGRVFQYDTLPVIKLTNVIPKEAFLKLSWQ